MVCYIIRRVWLSAAGTVPLPNANPNQILKPNPNPTTNSMHFNVFFWDL